MMATTVRAETDPSLKRLIAKLIIAIVFLLISLTAVYFVILLEYLSIGFLFGKETSIGHINQHIFNVDTWINAWSTGLFLVAILAPLAFFIALFIFLFVIASSESERLMILVISAFYTIFYIIVMMSAVKEGAF